jgi:hypothetical protein
VLPSIAVSTKVVSKPSSLAQRTLIVELGNLVNSVSADSRSSKSAGQLDTEHLGSDHSDLAEGCAKIEGIWLLGRGEALSSHTAGITAKAHRLIAAPSERLSLCIPIAIPNSSGSASEDNAVNYRGSSSWLLPVNGSVIESGDPSTSPASIADRFLCNEVAATAFTKAVATARQQHDFEESANENAGPRSISQVRRDRQKELEAGGAGDGSGSDSPGARGASDISDLSGADALAAQDSANGQATVVVLWLVRWQGNVRRGMHVVRSVSLLGSRPTIEKSRAPVDSLLVGIIHPQSVTMSESAVDEYGNRGVTVPVELQLRSVHPRKLIVSVEAVDRRDRSSTVGGEGAGRESTGDRDRGSKLPPIDDGSSMALSKASSRGLTWYCKTKHKELTLSPQENIQLSFRAGISRTGVFDLKRYG